MKVIKFDKCENCPWIGEGGEWCCKYEREITSEKVPSWCKLPDAPESEGKK